MLSEMKADGRNDESKKAKHNARCHHRADALAMAVSTCLC